MITFIGGVVVGLLIAILHYVSKERIVKIGQSVEGYFAPSGGVIELKDPLDEMI